MVWLIRRRAAGADWRRRSRRGFTLIENVVAVALFAMIATPAIGVAILSAKANRELTRSSAVSELRERVKLALESDTTLALGAGAELLGYASLDLREIEIGPAVTAGAGAYYQIRLADAGVSGPGYRAYVCELRWPYRGSGENFEHESFAPLVLKE